MTMSSRLMFLVMVSFSLVYNLYNSLHLGLNKNKNSSYYSSYNSSYDGSGRDNNNDVGALSEMAQSLLYNATSSSTPLQQQQQQQQPSIKAILATNQTTTTSTDAAITEKKNETNMALQPVVITTSPRDVTNNNQTTTENNSKTRSQPSSLKAKVVFFDENQNSSNNAAPSSSNNNEFCTISNSSISAMKYLGCGFSGQVFAVHMDCSSLDHQRESDQQHHSRHSSSKTIALKLLTVPANKSDTKKFAWNRIGIYQSENNDTQQQLLKLYHRLVVADGDNGTDHENKDKVMRHFAVRIGTVQLPRPMVENVMSVVNPIFDDKKRHAYKQMVLDVDTNTDGDGSVNGYIYPTLPDSEPLTNIQLGPLGKLRKQNRHHQVVRDIVYIYHHMYLHGIIHCDMKLEHLLYSWTTSTTSMMDLDSFRKHNALKLPRKNNSSSSGTSGHKHHKHRYKHYRHFQWQQWQCMAVIANICDYKVQQQQQQGNVMLSPVHMACANSKPLDELTPRATYASIFENCSFEKDMVWKDNMLNHTEQTYQALAEWSGLVL